LGAPAKIKPVGKILAQEERTREKLSESKKNPLGRGEKEERCGNLGSKRVSKGSLSIAGVQIDVRASGTCQGAREKTFSTSSRMLKAPGWGR